MLAHVNIFFACLLLAILATHSVQAYNSLSFAKAQCTAKCLQLFALEVNEAVKKHRNDTRFVDLKRTLEQHPDFMLMFCTEKGKLLFPSCRSCVTRGCEAKVWAGSCSVTCQGDKGCQSGCQFLKEVRRNRAGTCPVLRAVEDSGSCFHSCQTDADCRMSLHKCCRSNCGSSCVAPKYNASVPKFGRQLRIFERTESHSIDLDWQSGRDGPSTVQKTDYLNPTVFLVQIRDYSGPEFSMASARSWTPVTTSTVMRAAIKGVQIGTWYQFRIAAVTTAGTRGFSTTGGLSAPWRLAKEPRDPTAPRNVSDGVWRIHASGNIHVQINWSPPEISDLPINHYQVEWVKDHGYVQSDGKSLEGFTRFRKPVPGDLTSYTIRNLSPSTSYKVQVTAVVRWGSTVMRSPPNTLFITTPHMWNPKETPRSKSGKKKGGWADRRCVCDNKTPGLFIYKPVYRNGSLDVKILLTKTTSEEDRPYLVEWSPKVCIATSEEARVHKISGRMKSTMESRVKVIKDLAFNCRYWLRVSPLESPARRDVITTCFCTPSCRDVLVPKRAKRPRCSPDNSLPVPSRPTNIYARKIGRQEFALTWARPKRERHFNRFRVVWGPREEEPVNKDMYGDSGLSPKIDFNLAETKVVSNNVTSMRLKNLRDATMYIVKIQALSYRDGRESESPEGVLYFTTDGFTNPPAVDDYQVVRQYVKSRRGNGITQLSPPAPWLLLLLLHFLLFLRDFT